MKKQTTDKIIRGITKDKSIRFFGVNCLESLKKVDDIHKFSITNKVVFGRLLAASLIMATDSKSDKEVVSLKLNSEGIAGGTIITANRKKQTVFVKGLMPNATVETPLKDGTFNVKEAIGKGFLQIIKDLGLKKPYVVNVELVYQEVAEDITYYYAKSVQIPTSLSLGVLIFPKGEIKQAGGFMIQLMPDTPEDIVLQLEDNIKKFPNLTDMLDLGHSLESLLKEYILKGFDTEVTEVLDIKYNCSCSRQKMHKGLALLDKKEIKSIFEEFGELKTSCSFCKKEYLFSKEDLL